VAHEESAELAVSSRCCGTIRYSNDPTVGFGTDQLLKIVSVDGDDKPPLLDCDVINLLIRDTGFMVVVSDMLDVKMCIQAWVLCPGWHILVIK
jgi:hypothetical protein